MIAEELVAGLRFTFAAVAEERVGDDASALAAAFERPEVDARLLVMEALGHDDDDVQALAAVLAIVEFGAVDRIEFLGECGRFLPARPDRLALLALTDTFSLSLLFVMIEASAWGPAELCRRLEHLADNGVPRTRGWSMLALGFLAEDEARARSYATESIRGEASSFVVSAAVFALMVLADEGALAVLREVALTDPDGAVRGSAYVVLAISGADVAPAFSDVDARALSGALTGRSVIGQLGLTDDEMRRVRARLRKRPLADGILPLIAGLLPQIDHLDPSLITDVEEVVSAADAESIASLRGILHTMGLTEGSEGFRRLSAAVTARTEELSHELV